MSSSRQLMFLVVVVAQAHDSKGAAGDLLIEKEHEGSGQHCLQQLGLQAFKQTQHAILPYSVDQQAPDSPDTGQ